MRVFQLGAQPLQPQLAALEPFVLLHEQLLLPGEFGLLALTVLVPQVPFAIEGLAVDVDGGGPRRATLQHGLVFAVERADQFVERFAVDAELLLAAFQLPGVVFQPLPFLLSLGPEVGLRAFEIEPGLFEMFLLEPQPIIEQHTLAVELGLLCGQMRTLRRKLCGALSFRLRALLVKFVSQLGPAAGKFLFPTRHEVCIVPLLFVELLADGRRLRFPHRPFGVEHLATLLPLQRQAFPEVLPFGLQLLVDALLNPFVLGS
jgi:hypothetical protein